MGLYDTIVLAHPDLEAYVRLGEASGADAVDAAGGPDWAYVGTHTKGVAGPLARDADTGVLFNGGYALAGDNLDGFGAGREAGYSVEFWMKTASLSEGAICGVFSTGGYANGFNVYCHFPSAGVIDFTSTDDSVSVCGAKWDASDLFDNEWHHLLLAQRPSTAESWAYADGAAVAGLEAVGGVLGSLSAFTQPMAIGGRNVAGTKGWNFTATLDEFAFYSGVLTAADARAHYLAGRYARRPRIAARSSAVLRPAM